MQHPTMKIDATRSFKDILMVKNLFEFIANFIAGFSQKINKKRFFEIKIFVAFLG